MSEHMTLTEFLLARIAEDEERARFDGAHWSDCEHFHYYAEGGLPCTCGMEQRLLAECVAKRRIVERYALAIERARLAKDRDFFAIDPIVRDLAVVYADHPDYDQAWRP